MLQIRKLWSQYRQATKDFRVESPIDEISEIMEQLNIIVPPLVMLLIISDFAKAIPNKLLKFFMCA